MNLIFFVRHGSYFRTRENGLSVEGHIQMTHMGWMIKNIIGNACPVILSSLSARGRASAEILREILKCSEVIATDAFGLVEGYMVDADAALRTIEAHAAAEVLVVVTHHECFEKDGAAYIYATNIVGIRRFPPDEIRNGDAVMIEVKSKTAVHVSPVPS